MCILIPRFALPHPWAIFKDMLEDSSLALMPAESAFLFTMLNEFYIWTIPVCCIYWEKICQLLCSFAWSGILVLGNIHTHLIWNKVKLTENLTIPLLSVFLADHLGVSLQSFIFKLHHNFDWKRACTMLGKLFVFSFSG